MRELDAIDKWCPMVRIRRAGDFILNDRGEEICDSMSGYDTEKQGDLSRCIGSECMMWVEFSKGSGIDAHGCCGLCQLP